MTNLAVTAQWYATIFYFKSVTCQQMGLANLVALSATTYISTLKITLPLP